MGLFSTSISPTPDQSEGSLKRIGGTDGDYISYNSRLPPGERLKRKMTPHNLILFQCWFTVLKDQDGKVAKGAIAMRLKSAGIIRNSQEEESFLTCCKRELMSFDEFLDSLALSKCYEGSRVSDAKFDDGKFVVAAGPDTSGPVRRKSIVEYIRGDLGVRRPSLLDTWRRYCEGGVQGKSEVRTVSTKRKDKQSAKKTTSNAPSISSMFIGKEKNSRQHRP